MTAVYLGVGRSKADDQVLPHVGIELHKKPGERVRPGDSLATLYGTTAEKVEECREYGAPAFTIDGTGAGAGAAGAGEGAPRSAADMTREMIIEEIANV
jgi:thymidine phosphorylase